MIRKWFVKLDKSETKKMWNKCEDTTVKYLWWNCHKQNKIRTNPTPQKQWDNNEKQSNRHQHTNLNKSFNTTHKNNLKFELCPNTTRYQVKPKLKESFSELLSQKRTNSHDWHLTKTRQFQESFLNRWR